MSEKTNDAWLVYRPVQDYEESIVPYLICDTEERANAVVRELREWLTAFAATLPDALLSGTDASPGATRQERAAASVRQGRLVEEAAPPYGLRGILGDLQCYSYGKVGLVAEAMKLPCVTNA